MLAYRFGDVCNGGGDKKWSKLTFYRERECVNLIVGIGVSDVTNVASIET